MHIDVKTDLKEINGTANTLISAIRDKTGINDETEYKIKLILKELLTNILSYSDAGLVTVDASIENSVLTLTIEDNGSGFNHEEIMGRDVTDQNFLMCEGGRGIFLVRMVADSICFNDKGNRVQVRVSLD